MATNCFRQETEKIKDWLIELRREFHQHPEPSMEEFRTCRTIKETLSELGLEPEPNFPEPAVVATLTGAEETGPTIALRADMDALPITEKNEVPYASQNPGLMHACGHDAHLAMLLGAGMVLNKRRSQLPGNVKLIFQPSEETYPGGARMLIEHGVLENPHVDAIFAHHVQSHLEVGQVGVKPGNFMASTREFTLTVKGKSGHAAHPQRGIDSIVITAQIIMAFQTIASRLTSPTTPVVVSACTIAGGVKPNVLAGEVTVAGTVRVLEEAVGQQVERQMEEIVRGLTQTYGAGYSLHFQPGYPAVQNDPALAELVTAAAAKIVGKEHVIQLEQPSMGGEDFGWYQRYRPGVITNLGCGNAARGLTAPIHNERFDIDEDCLVYGAAITAQVAWDYLRARP